MNSTRNILGILVALICYITTTAPSLAQESATDPTTLREFSAFVSGGWSYSDLVQHKPKQKHCGSNKWVNLVHGKGKKGTSRTYAFCVVSPTNRGQVAIHRSSSCNTVWIVHHGQCHNILFSPITTLLARKKQGDEVMFFRQVD